MKAYKFRTAFAVILALVFAIPFSCAEEWQCSVCGNSASGNYCSNCGTQYNSDSSDGETHISFLLTEAKNHSFVSVDPSPDKYTWYIQDYVGRSLSSVGYTSIGGDRLERYGSGVLEFILVNADGTYIDIMNEEDLANYIVIGQNIEPNTEMNFIFRKDSSGEEYSNLVDNQSFDQIDLYVVRYDGVLSGDPVDYTPTALSPSPDKYTQYVRNYVGKNLLSFGYTSMGGNRMDEYGDARVKFVLVTDDGSTVDVSDDAQLASYVVIQQDVAPNSQMVLTYKKDSKGEEYSNLVDTQSFETITLKLMHVELPEGFGSNVGTEEDSETETDSEEEEIEAVGYEAMTLEELYSARSEIDAEIQKRLMNEDTIIYEGTYRIGSDIEPGAYILSGKDDTIIAHVYNTESDFKNYDTAINDFIPESGYFLGLREGMVLEVLIGNGYLTPAPTDYDGTTIYEGTYHVGVDIAPGKYVLSGIDDTIITHVYNTEQDFEEYNTAINDFVSTSGYALTLEEGMVFEVVTGNGFIIKQ